MTDNICPICDHEAELKRDVLGEYYFCSHCIEEYCTDEQLLESLINAERNGKEEK